MSVSYNGIGPNLALIREDLPARLIRDLLSTLPVHSGCVGHFFDKSRGCVDLRLGKVNVFSISSYRAASSDSAAEKLGTVKPFDGEDAAQYDSLGDEHRPERSEDGAQSPKKEADYPTIPKGQKISGFYVIPGQTPMGRTNLQKNHQKNLKTMFQLSFEKPRGETC